MARHGAHQPAKPRPKPAHRNPVASGERDASTNRAAGYHYHLSEKFEAGIVLTGTEVKSIRAGHVNLKDAYGILRSSELWLINLHISHYQPGSIFNHEPLRTRKLLVHAQELHKLAGKLQQKGLTLIPTRMYFRHGKVKVEMALARGKQLWDKRETERRRTADREAREAMQRAKRT